jgi:hypothetical protein
MGVLLVVGMVIAAVASSGIDRVIVAGVQQAVCEVAAVSDSDCGAPERREGVAPGSQTEGGPSDTRSEGSEGEPSVARLAAGEAQRGAVSAVAPAGVGQAAVPASGQAGGAMTCFASSTGDCGPADGPPDGAYLPPERYEDPGDEVGDAIVDGAGELSGYNDADDAVEAFGDGELFSGLVSGILASPFGKVPKAAEKVFDGARGLVGGQRRRPPADQRAQRPCPANSFAAGTPVLMADGTQRPIEDVHVGDLVTATDPTTATTGGYPVTRLITGAGTKEMVAITTHDRTLRATAQHPFWAAEQRTWIDAGDLATGDTLRRPDATKLSIDAVHHYTERGTTVYNLTVADAHTYYAGHTPVLTHNANKDCKDKTEGESNEQETDQEPDRRRGEPAPVPRELEAFPDTTRAPRKTPVQGGGGLRQRWKDSKGRIYEFDRQEDAVEVYTKRGKHLGEFDHRTGRQLKPTNPSRRVEP